MANKWYDGEPYYCATCDLAFDICVCEGAARKLETRGEAQARAVEPYSLYMRDFDEREARHKEP